MTYDFKLLPEALRAGAFALIVFIATLLAGFDLDVIWSDPEAYARAGISGSIAAVGAAVLGVLTRAKA